MYVLPTTPLIYFCSFVFFVAKTLQHNARPKGEILLKNVTGIALCGRVGRDKIRPFAKGQEA